MSSLEINRFENAFLLLQERKLERAENFIKEFTDLLGSPQFLKYVSQRKSKIDETYFFIGAMNEIIFGEVQGRHFGEDVEFDFHEDYGHLSDFYRDINYIGGRPVPWDEWPAIRELVVQNFVKLATKNKLNSYKKEKSFLDTKKAIIEEVKKLKEKYPVILEPNWSY